jgi:PleD family two-component response regulator
LASRASDRRPSGAKGAGDADRPDLSDVDILVAEDNPTNQTILRGMLERLGARTHVFASDGAEALEALGHEVSTSR